MNVRAAVPVSMPFMLLGERHRALVCDVVRECVNSWLSEWSASSCKAIVRLDEDPASSRLVATQVPKERVQANDTAGLLLRIDAQPQLMGLLVGAQAAGAPIVASSGIVAAELRLELLRSLCHRILKRAASDGAVIDAASAIEAPVRTERRFLSIEVALGSERRALSLTLSPLLLQRLLPARASSKPSTALVDRKAAVGCEKIRVRAVVAGTTLSIADLAKLAEGDVIVLDHPLDQPCLLIADDGRPIAKGLLGQADTRRALSVLS